MTVIETQFRGAIVLSKNEKGLTVMNTGMINEENGFDAADAQILAPADLRRLHEELGALLKDGGGHDGD